MRHCWWLHLKLWSLPHYRSGTFQKDLVKNLRNVALPGTGLPLSMVCRFWPVALLFLWVGIPFAALVAAIIRSRRDSSALGCAFAAALLSEYPWFHFWRLNCAIASYHALRTSDPGDFFFKSRRGVAPRPFLYVAAHVIYATSSHPFSTAFNGTILR